MNGGLLVLIALPCQKLFDVAAEFLVGHSGGLGESFRDRRVLLCRLVRVPLPVEKFGEMLAE